MRGCHGLTFCSAKRRRTVSRDSAVSSVRRTSSPASSPNVQRERPPRRRVRARDGHQQRFFSARAFALGAGPGLLG